MVICKHLITEGEPKQAENCSYSLRMLTRCVKDLCFLAKVRIFKTVTAKLNLYFKYLMSVFFNEVILSDQIQTAQGV